jgi:hypothetical protein
MRHLPVLLTAIACTIGAAEPAVPGALVKLDFNDGVMPPAIHDNTYKGDKPTLQIVDAAEAKRGKELSIRVAPGGFAQIILGKVPAEAGSTYAGLVTMSALADAEVRFYLRMAEKPYTVLLASTVKVGTTPAVHALSGLPKLACESAFLMLSTEAQTTLRVDDISLVTKTP